MHWMKQVEKVLNENDFETSKIEINAFEAMHGSHFPELERNPETLFYSSELIYKKQSIMQ